MGCKARSIRAERVGEKRVPDVEPAIRCSSGLLAKQTESVSYGPGGRLRSVGARRTVGRGAGNPVRGRGVNEPDSRPYQWAGGQAGQTGAVVECAVRGGWGPDCHGGLILLVLGGFRWWWGSRCPGVFSGTMGSIEGLGSITP
ncbi:hypothetical protein GCM10008937_28480 [Deinococcus depolymerans]|uniref:Uncharacterized protein n=1 Tax=Deinococcus depolymerans TaxID=392408 RepID=A0ABN1CHA3_9DEIO